MQIHELIKRDGKFVIGMVHCLPLPGTMNYGGSCQDIFAQAVEDAKTLERCGIHAIMIENMGDTPFAEKLDRVQANTLAIVTSKIRDVVSVPIGIDAAFNEWETAFSIAHIVGAQFIRIPVFVDTVEFYGGVITPCAREAVLYRKRIQSEDVMILADIQVKHTNMVIPNISIESSAINAEVCGADAIIVTGSVTGEETPLEIIERVKRVVSIPVLAGSVVTAANVQQQFRVADGAIVGTALKEGGKLTSPISEHLVEKLMGALSND